MAEHLRVSPDRVFGVHQAWAPSPGENSEPASPKTPKRDYPGGHVPSDKNGQVRDSDGRYHRSIGNLEDLFGPAEMIPAPPEGYEELEESVSVQARPQVQPAVKAAAVAEPWIRRRSELIQLPQEPRQSAMQPRQLRMEIGCGDCEDCRQRLSNNPNLRLQIPIGNILAELGPDELIPAPPSLEQRAVEIIQPKHESAAPAAPNSDLLVVQRLLQHKCEPLQRQLMAHQNLVRQPVSEQPPVAVTPIRWLADSAMLPLGHSNSTPSTPANRAGRSLATPDTWGREMFAKALAKGEKTNDHEVRFLGGLLTSCCPNACDDPDDSDDDEEECCPSCGRFGPLFISLKPCWEMLLRCLVDTWKCISNLLWQTTEAPEEGEKNSAIEISVVKTPSSSERVSKNKTI